MSAKNYGRKRHYRRRRETLRRIILNREISVSDRDFAVLQAEDVVSRFPQAAVASVAFIFIAIVQSSSLFPITAGSIVVIAIAIPCLTIYLASVIMALRVWIWLRRQRL